MQGSPWMEKRNAITQALSSASPLRENSFSWADLLIFPCRVGHCNVRTYWQLHPAYERECRYIWSGVKGEVRLKVWQANQWAPFPLWATEMEPWEFLPGSFPLTAPCCWFLAIMLLSPMVCCRFLGDGMLLTPHLISDARVTSPGQHNHKTRQLRFWSNGLTHCSISKS